MAATVSTATHRSVTNTSQFSQVANESPILSGKLHFLPFVFVLLK